MILKNNLLVLLIIFAGSVSAQSVDYHTKKGFGASGFDLLSYFDGEVMLGTDSFIAEYDGVRYRFINQENKDRFLANPEDFIPQYGGYCAYAMAVSSKKVSVDPQTYEIRDSRLYLFYNSGRNNTLESWLAESPETLREKADSNWENVKRLRR